MSELRHDPLSGRWSVLAFERAQRPLPAAKPRSRPDGGACPFCPGNEHETETPLLRYDGPRGAWQLRVVPNKYADLAYPDGNARPQGDPLHLCMPSAGFAEVLIESPDHDATFDSHDPEQATRVIRAAQERYRALAMIPGVAVVMVFRNYLPESGASLAHPHGQILASSHLPSVLEAEAAHFTQYRRSSRGKCLGCMLLAAERDGPRVVRQTPDYLTLAPYAARAPYELLVMPAAHAGNFLRAEPAALARTLQDAYRRLRRVLGAAPANMWIHCRPISGRGDFHWHVHLTPRVTVEGGWELGSGLAVNTIPPEQAAQELRDQ